MDKWIKIVSENIGMQAPMSPTELTQKKNDLKIASRDPSAQLSVKTPSGTAEVKDFEGLIDDPDDPNAQKVAVAGDMEGEFEMIDIQDADLLEDITRLAGVKNEDGEK